MPNFWAPAYFAPSWRFGEEEGWRKTKGQPLEREDYVDNLLSVAWLLNVANVTATAVGDAGFGNFLKGNGVGVCNVLWADHAGNLEFTNLEVDARLLAPVDDEIAVR